MKNKEKNGFSRLLLPEILTVLIGGAAVYGLGLLGKQLAVENALRDAVMAALGLAVSGFFLRREVVDSRLDYDNGEHLMRFWTAVWCSLLFSLACASFRREDGRFWRSLWYCPCSAICQWELCFPGCF